MASAGAVIAATFMGLCVYALVRARAALAETRRIRALTAAATPTLIRDAPTSGAVIFSGRVAGAGGAVVRAPFTGEEVLWARAVAQSNVGAVINEWVVNVDAIVLDDRSGRVASVELGGADVRLPTQSVTSSDAERRIADFFESIGRSPGSGEFYYQAVLRPDDTRSVLATIPTARGGYRDSAAALTLSSRAGELVIFDEATESADPALRQRYIGAAIFGIVFFGALTAILAMIELG